MMRRNFLRRMGILGLAIGAASWIAAGPLLGWGRHGHTIIAHVAVRTLPPDMPPFFRAAEDQLAYLNPEPDRWRDPVETELDAAMDTVFTPDHWVHLDEVPKEVLEAPNRIDYILALGTRGIDPKEVGTLPYRILELTQRLRSGFRRWRQETDPAARQWIQQRIVNDAGILGHYVADGSNPHHTSRHHDNWVGPNPRRFTDVPGFHGRFEGQFVSARITLDELQAAVTAPPVVFPSIRAAAWDHLRRSHDRLIRLYELDQIRAFGPDTDTPDHKAFALERLTAGAQMLRDLWWTAWVTSAIPPAPAAVTPPPPPAVPVAR